MLYVMLYSILFYLWFTGTLVLTLASTGALIFVVVKILRRKELGRHLILTTILVAICALSIFLNPMANWRMFHGRRTKVVDDMKAMVGKSTELLISQYGRPDAIRDHGGVRWVYEPGPWYVLLKWEDVVYSIDGGKITGCTIDD